MVFLPGNSQIAKINVTYGDLQSLPKQGDVLLAAYERVERMARLLKALGADTPKKKPTPAHTSPSGSSIHTTIHFRTEFIRHSGDHPPAA
jgi:hypothetical protein